MSANPIHSNTIETDQNGILAEWVAQPTSTPSESLDNLQYVESFKGPYSEGRTILDKIKVGDDIGTAHTALGTLGIGLNILFNPPNDPVREGVEYRWLVKTIECKQIQAGDHCLLTIRYQGYDTSQESDVLTDDPYQDQWSISWQSYTVTPWAFCENPTDSLNRNYPVGQSQGPDPLNWTASRSTIELNLSQNAQKDTFKRLYELGAQEYELNQAEKLVKQKVQANINAIYHYPVIVHQTVKKCEYGNITSYSDTIGEDLDIISANLPNDCPYQFPNETPPWKWMKIGDDITQTHTKTTTSFTRREVWQGMKNADINYYGDISFDHANLISCRWEIGQV